MTARHDHLTHPRYRADIDGLRAIAVLSVIGFHAFPGLIQGGFIGVDIFFVISGFLISTIIFENLARGSFSFVEFYSRRIKRIFPALILVLIASFAAGWFTLLAHEYKQLGKHIVSGAGFVSNFALWNESGYFDAAATRKPLLHLWSLGIEEQFYIIWPLLLWLAWSRRLNLLAITLAIATTSFVLNVSAINSDAIAAFYSPWTRFWELLVGSALAYSVRTGQSVPAAVRCWNINLRAFGGVLLIALGMLLLNKERAFPGWWALLPTVGAALIISAGTQAWPNRMLLSNRLLVWFGLISYPLYLWHWPLLAFAHIVAGGTPSRGMRAAALLVSVGLAWLTYKGLEKPIRFGRHGKTKTAALLGLMVVVGFVGYNSYQRYGLMFRKINKGQEIKLYDADEGYRAQTCFIGAADETSNTFADFCIGNNVGNRPLVMLWGDSHAASLYRGLLSESNVVGYNLAQYNASGCPPLLGFKVAARKECEHVNSFVLQQIAKYRPDTVIMAAFWTKYNGAEGWELLNERQIEETISRLKSLNIRHIVLVGNLPHYTPDQFIVGNDIFVPGGANRTFNGFRFDEIESDKVLASIAERSGVDFISPIDLLCDKSGCLMSVSRDKFVPLAWDYGHLTEDGSVFLVRRAIQNGLLSPARK